MAHHSHGRRKKRKSVAIVAFDFASLGLSSTVAEQAIDTVREHTQTLNATADMNHDEAVKLHELEIQLHKQGLQQARVKIAEVQEGVHVDTTDEGRAARHEASVAHNAQAEIHAAMLKAHKTVLDHRIGLAADSGESGLTEIQRRESVKDMVNAQLHSIKHCASNSLSTLANGYLLEQRLKRDYSNAWRHKTISHRNGEQGVMVSHGAVSSGSAFQAIEEGDAEDNNDDEDDDDDDDDNNEWWLRARSVGKSSSSGAAAAVAVVAEVPAKLASGTTQLAANKTTAQVSATAAVESTIGPSEISQAALRAATADAERAHAGAARERKRAEAAEQAQKDAESQIDSLRADLEAMRKATATTPEFLQATTADAERARADAARERKRAEAAEQAQKDAESLASRGSDTTTRGEIDSLRADLEAMRKATVTTAESLQAATADAERARASAARERKRAEAAEQARRDAEIRAEVAEQARQDAENRATRRSDTTSRAEIDSLRTDLEAMKEALDAAKLSGTTTSKTSSLGGADPSSGGGGGGLRGRPAGSISVDLAGSIPPARLSRSVRASPLYAWLAENSTERIDLRQYAQTIHDADIGMASLEVLDDDALVADLIPQEKASHRNLLRQSVRLRRRTKNDSKIESERVKRLLVHTWLQGIDSGDGTEAGQLAAYAGVLDRQGITMQNITALLHQEIASSLIQDATHRAVIVKAAHAYHERSCFLLEHRPSSRSPDRNTNSRQLEATMNPFRGSSPMRTSTSTWEDFIPPSPGVAKWPNSVGHLQEATRDLAVAGASVNAMQIEAMQDVRSFRRFLTDMKARVVPQVQSAMHALPGRPRESESSRLKHWVAQRRESSSLNHKRRKKRPQSPYRTRAMANSSLI
jgi:hypothetical protein